MIFISHLFQQKINLRGLRNRLLILEDSFKTPEV